MLLVGLASDVPAAAGVFDSEAGDAIGLDDDAAEGPLSGDAADAAVALTTADGDATRGDATALPSLGGLAGDAPAAGESATSGVLTIRKSASGDAMLVGLALDVAMRSATT